MGRLTDNDKRFWFVEYGKTRHNPISIEYSSGDDEKSEGYKNELIWYMFGHIFRIKFPAFIKHHAVKVQAKYWSKETIEKKGRDWYWAYSTRRYGFRIRDGYLHINYGADTGDSDTEKSKCWSFPWHNQRIVKEEIYTKLALYWSWVYSRDTKRQSDEYYNATKTCPKTLYRVRDFDGEMVTAELYRHVTVYKQGTGYFEWVSWFVKDLVNDAIHFEFDKETGTEKGSYKGGLIATGTDFLPGDTFYTAFERWCNKNNMTIIAEMAYPI